MKDKHLALVTGAAQGIGRAIALSFAKAKVDGLILVDKQEVKLRELASSIETTYQLAVNCLVVDVANSEEVQSALNSLGDLKSQISILVNNAGYGGPFHRIDEVTDDEWHEVFDVNVKGVFNFSRALLPSMKKNGFGRIINIASIQGYLGASRSSTYVAAKHAVIGYSRAIAAEWGRFGICCNAVCPGYIDTAMGAQDAHSCDHEKNVCQRTPAARLGLPEEVASLVMYLAQKEASYINGSICSIDGGFSSHIGF